MVTCFISIFPPPTLRQTHLSRFPTNAFHCVWLYQFWCIGFRECKTRCVGRFLISRVSNICRLFMTASLFKHSTMASLGIRQNRPLLYMK